MSLPRYAEYKDSGVAWLGEVPAHWSWASLKWISKRYSGGTPDKTRLEYWEDGTVPWINSGAVNDQTITEPSTYITEQAFENSSAKWIPAGALVMALAGQGKTKGMVAQVLFETTCNQSMAAIVPSPEVCERYLYWWLVGNYQNIRNMAGGDLRDGLNLELLGSIACPLPFASEQSAIAAFLDRETGKIDALIAEQEKLLTLLGEKRQATISHAVTRGLNPNAPMKDSGVQWLGDVPSHWEVKGVSRSFKAKKGGNAAELTKEYCATIEGEYPVFSGQTENEGVMGFIDRYEFDAADDGWILSTTVGAKAMSVKHLKGRFSLSQNCMVILPVVGDVVTRFFFYHLQPLFLYERRMIPDHMQPSFRMEDLYRYKVAIPPKDEQRAIASFLDSEIEKLDGLRLEVEHAIALLKERRSVLIAAAVTGKIDVREV
jgi:type I restriction enzyme S subunit